MVRRAVAAVLAAALLAGCGGDGGTDEPDDAPSFRGAVLEEQYVVPKTALRDTEGEPYSLAKDTERPLTLVFFGYTNCPDICQVVMASLASALTRLDEADREQVEVVFVTTDPARDDTAVLRDYLDRFDPSFIGLTGDLQTIIDVAEPLAVFVDQGEKLPTGGYDVSHSTQVTAIDDRDRVPVVWTQGTSAAEFADDIHTLLTEG